jgi:hypothetical protein
MVEELCGSGGAFYDGEDHAGQDQAEDSDEAVGELEKRAKKADDSTDQEGKEEKTGKVAKLAGEEGGEILFKEKVIEQEKGAGKPGKGVREQAQGELEGRIFHINLRMISLYRVWGRLRYMSWLGGVGEGCQSAGDGNSITAFLVKTYIRAKSIRTMIYSRAYFIKNDPSLRSG